MKLHTLSEFSKTVMRQTEQSVSYFFWSWLGGCILWMLCRIAFCYAVQISFTFLGREPDKSPHCKQQPHSIPGSF